MGTEPVHSAYAAVLKQKLTSLIALHKNGETQDVSLIAQGVWSLLYEHIPQLTHSKHKDDQHKTLEDVLVDIGLPPSKDLQWVAGPMLWYAREQKLLPSAVSNGQNAESWTLDEAQYAGMRKELEKGFLYYGSWMTDALQAVLCQQR